jgi:hypothetical protein
VGEEIAVGDRIEWCSDIDGRPIEPGDPEARTYTGTVDSVHRHLGDADRIDCGVSRAVQGRCQRHPPRHRAAGASDGSRRLVGAARLGKPFGRVSYCRRVLVVGSLVKKSADSDHVFEIVEIEDDARALIAATGDEAPVPGSYPYWWPLRLLTPARDTAPGR